jgi:hypothetical protein
VQCPEGELQKRKEVVHTVSVNEIVDICTITIVSLLIQLLRQLHNSMSPLVGLTIADIVVLFAASKIPNCQNINEEEEINGLDLSFVKEINDLLDYFSHLKKIKLGMLFSYIKQWRSCELSGIKVVSSTSGISYISC